MRLLKWVPEEKLLNRDFRNNLNYRLLFKDFLNYLYSLKIVIILIILFITTIIMIIMIIIINDKFKV